MKKRPNPEAKAVRSPAYRPRRTPTKAEKEARDRKKVKTHLDDSGEYWDEEWRDVPVAPQKG